MRTTPPTKNLNLKYLPPKPQELQPLSAKNSKSTTEILSARQPATVTHRGASQF